MEEQIKTCVEVQLAGEQLLEAAEIARELNPENAPMISASPVGNTEQDHRYAQAILTGKKWPQNQTITISFLSGTADQQAYVKKYAQEWFDITNLKPQWVASGGMIRIEIASGGGSWSYMGPDCLAIKDMSQATMRFGWLDPSVVRHEFGHAMGMIHEHQHPGRPWHYDEPVVIAYYSGPPNNWDRASIQRNVLDKYTESQVNASAFDRESIMLYSVSNKFTIEDYEVGWNQVLSAGDKAFVQGLYPRSGAPVQPPNPPPVIPVWKQRGYWYEGVGRNRFVKTPASNEFGTGSYKQFGWIENTAADSDDLIIHQPKTQAAQRDK